MKILALDTATSTGWACGDSRERPRFGTKTLKHAPNSYGPSGAQFDAWLRGSIAGEQPDMICFESPILAIGGPRPKTSLQGARLMLGLIWHVEFVAAQLDIKCREVSIQEAKLALTGQGNADKAAMMRAAKMYGFDVETDHEADAIGVWAVAALTVDPRGCRVFSMGALGARARG